jgi:hypothetical protein
MVGGHISSVGQDFVALSAADGGVSAFQRKSGLAVTREREIGRYEAFYGMAILATVFVRCAGELPFVNIDVAIQAKLIFYAILRGFAGWTVTFIAGNRGMLSRKRISALCVGGNRKRRWFPAFHFMAACAFALVRPFDKLARMYVLVAGLAELVRHRHLEVGSVMALRATHFEVFSYQGVLRFGMIEGLRDVAQRFPICVVVARGAVCAQRPFMRVLMAILTSGERNAGVAHARFDPIRSRFLLVALRAGRGAVCAGQGELRFGVVEARDIFPLRHLAVVFVLVARHALALQSEIRAAEIPHTNCLPGIRHDVFRRVTSLALQLCVTAFQRVTSLPVIEFVHVHVPQDRNEVPAVVLRVTLDTGVIAATAAHQGWMQAAPFG